MLKKLQKSEGRLALMASPKIWQLFKSVKPINPHYVGAVKP
jgi:hypothetical protein